MHEGVGHIDDMSVHRCATAIAAGVKEACDAAHEEPSSVDCRRPAVVSTYRATSAGRNPVLAVRMRQFGLGCTWLSVTHRRNSGVPPAETSETQPERTAHPQMSIRSRERESANPLPPARQARRRYTPHVVNMIAAARLKQGIRQTVANPHKRFFNCNRQ
jgi:hypothetical protein